jgi:hypothetical protein
MPEGIQVGNRRGFALPAFTMPVFIFLLINNQLHTFSQIGPMPIVKMADMLQGVFDF